MSDFRFDMVVGYIPDLIDGVWLTLALSVVSVGMGLVLGLVLALARYSALAPLSWPAYAYIEFFRTTPALVQLVWIYYSLPIFTGLQLPSFASVAIGLGLHSAAYFAEIFRAGIQSIERGQGDAARSLGMSRRQAMRRIILPQAVQRMIPPFINETASLIKLTTLGSVLAVNELLHASNNLITTTYRPLEIYTALAAIFAVIIYPIVYLSRRLERHWALRS